MFSKQRNNHHAYEGNVTLEPGAREGRQWGDWIPEQAPSQLPWVPLAGFGAGHRNVALAANPQSGNICPQLQKGPMPVFTEQKVSLFLGPWAGQEVAVLTLPFAASITSSPTLDTQRNTRSLHIIPKRQVCQKSRVSSTCPYVCFQMLFFPLCWVWMNHILRKCEPVE